MGRHIEKPGYKRTTIFIDPSFFKMLKVWAVQNDKSLSYCIEEAIKDFLRKKKIINK